MLVAIGTKNKAKISAVETVVKQLLNEQIEFQYIAVESGVSAQPMSDAETREGAINRALNTHTASKADFSFGLEGGVKDVGGVMYVCNWGTLVLKDGTIITAAGAQIPLPNVIATAVNSGLELGPVMDEYTQQNDIRQHSGAIGIFTKDLIDRKEMFEHVIKLLIGQYFFQKG
ncbi:DUF84 family protein [Viridibacillus sp. YIM B01967]|uniref:inosine/xanthosine triphosphatase n=2 Tax=Viridibacillus soli TaxID=2798301 RepID=A0ABS1H9G0_9BACL|nr:DUF84 family protein [Viridibacillus soli]